MKRMAKYAWALCGVATAILVADAWRLWSDRNDPIRYWRAELRKRSGGGRHEPISMLARQPSPEAVPDLIALLEDPDEEVRILAIQGIARILAPGRSRTNPAGFPPGLIDELKARARGDVSARVRAWAIDSLSVLIPDDPEARALFREQLDGPTEGGSIRAAACGPVKPGNARARALR